MGLKIALAVLLALALAWGVVLHRARAQEAVAVAAHPPRGELIEVDGQQVHAVVMGPEAGEAPDLVLIHGASGNFTDWTFRLGPELAQDYRVIIFDRPGLGYTDRVAEDGTSVIRQAAVLQEAAARLGARNPVVLGHSYGGAVALAWAINHPDHLAALVAVSAASHPWDTGLSTYYRLLSHPVAGPLVIPPLTAFVPQSRVQEAIAEVFQPDDVPEGYFAHFAADLTLRRSSLRANALQRASLLSEIKRMVPYYEDIKVPTEILHGTADTTVGLSIHSQPLAKKIRNANLVLLPGTGHMPHHAEPDEIVAAIHRAAARAGLRPAP
ncbi:alpha/beta fold hydrolase [Roseovarius aestuariivivens]|uniref:alpha/beta fold hydrolase n=1 Tax=Roseovarius aestuariivivens TaxID=1888910 RepID=UPI001080CD5F|nr:alpha/beta hydrolase [Roseovarius aestuariivivens]